MTKLLRRAADDRRGGNSFYCCPVEFVSSLFAVSEPVDWALVPETVASLDLEWQGFHRTDLRGVEVHFFCRSHTVYALCWHAPQIFSLHG